MGWPSFRRQGDIGFRGPRGMLRRPSSLILPPEVAYLAQNVRFGPGIAERRPGAVRLLGVTPYATASLVFDGTTGKYVQIPDNAVLDLGTKWAIAVHFKTTGTPGGTQYVYSRDVTPTTAGKKTFSLYVNSSLRVGFDCYIGGTNYPLTAAAESAISGATKVTVLIVRNGASLAMYLNGGSSAVLSRSDLPATTVCNAGAEALYIAQNYDGSSRTGAFDGTIGWFGLFRDYASVAQLRKYTTYQPYPDAKDPRVALYFAWSYSIEAAGATAYDLSTTGNNGTIVGSPTRAASIAEAPINKVQALFTFKDPLTGVVKVGALVGGDLYSASVRTS